MFSPLFPSGYSVTLAALMPKMKSHSGAKKRLHRTGGGRLALRRSGRNHLLLQKSKRQKRLNRTLTVERPDIKRLKALVPYI